MPNKGPQVRVPDNLGVKILEFQRRFDLSDYGMTLLVGGALSRGTWANYKRNVPKVISRTNLKIINRMLNMTENEIKENLEGHPVDPRKRQSRVPTAGPKQKPLTYNHGPVSRKTADLGTKLLNNFHQLSEKDQLLLTQVSARLARSARILKSALEQEALDI